MKEYFKLNSNDKKELLGIAERLKASAEKNLTPQLLPQKISSEDLTFAEDNHLPQEFFQFFEIERAKN